MQRIAYFRFSFLVSPLLFIGAGPEGTGMETNDLVKTSTLTLKISRIAMYMREPWNRIAQCDSSQSGKAKLLPLVANSRILTPYYRK